MVVVDCVRRCTNLLQITVHRDGQAKLKSKQGAGRAVGFRARRSATANRFRVPNENPVRNDAERYHKTDGRVIDTIEAHKRFPANYVDRVWQTRVFKCKTPTSETSTACVCVCVWMRIHAVAFFREVAMTETDWPTGKASTRWTVETNSGTIKSQSALDALLDTPFFY